MASWQDKFLKPVTEDMEDFTAAMDAVNVDLDEFLSRYWLTWLAYVNVRLHLKPKSRDSFVPSFLRSFVPSFLRSFARSFVRSFVLSLVRSFVHSFISSNDSLRRSLSELELSGCVLVWMPPTRLSPAASAWKPP